MNIFDNIDYYDDLFNDQSRRRLELDIPRRYLRDSSDPYAMDEQRFKRRYRFSQNVVKNFILNLISPDLTHLNKRGLPVAPEIQLLLCLRFYATASFQLVCGDLLNISQPQASRIIAKISNILAKKNKQFIKYRNNMVQCRREFANSSKHNGNCFHDIDGAIDCTHIKIVNTPGVQHHEAYRNRKSYFSINVQAVVGPTGEFTNVVARWAGSTHDSRILQMSNVNLKYREGIHNGKLVGDGGYPCLPYLLTPLRSPSNSAEEIYNIMHKKTRNIVERTFGKWKRRFPCLQKGMGNKLSTVCDIIVTCAILHNIAVKTNDDIDDEGLVPEEIPNNDNINTSTPHDSADGIAVRAAIISRLTI